MIYFVTNNKQYYQKQFDNVLFSDITVLDAEEGKELFYKRLAKKKLLALDIEATGLDAYLSTPLLYGIGTYSIQLMFDWTVNIDYIFKHFIKYNVISLGHNLLYDFKMIRVHNKVTLEKCYDTMLAEQRLWMRSGYEFNLAAVTERYLEKARIKETRNEFVGADINKFKIQAHHLYYLKDDLIDLFGIRDKQRPIIKKFKMEFLIYGIEFPLIAGIAESELKGYVLDVDKWRERLQAEKNDMFALQCELDDDVKQLRDLKAKDNPLVRTKLVGGKFDNKRTYNPLYDKFKPDGTSDEFDLFGEAATKFGMTKAKKKIEPYPNNTNYKSPTQVVRIFSALEEPLLNKAEIFEVPRIVNNKIDGGVNKFTLNENAFNKYILARPDSLMAPFIKKLIKVSKLDKSINTYGETFVTFINKVTGRLHTSFRQCFADTGRFQSGGGRNEPSKPNFQNIPRDKKYRNCFTTDTNKYLICTSDYTGAELLVMASHAQDKRLLELNDQDMHSYMATKCWRAIFGRRAMEVYNKYMSGTITNESIKQKLKEEYNILVDKAKNFIVNKETGELRTLFKPMTFGVIYGMFAKKAGVTLNIIKEEGQVVINVIKNELPLTFAMVERASQDAERTGYVIFDTRTNARAWFPILIKQLRGEVSKQTHFKEISEELSAARNIRMQGTQATFVKEASVVLRKHIKKNNIDATILAWVHDEIVDEFDKRYAEETTAPSTILSFGKTFKTYPEFKTYIMEMVANRYLHNVEIKVETQVHPYWTK